jgi:glycosyltransferase involved in cell wall biosynthesis
MQPLNILFIEPFYGGSHKAFADGLTSHSQHNFTLFTLPARYWKWRMRGAALEVTRAIPSPEKFDLVCAASMLSLADLKALWGTACPPLIAYYHENQLNYPLSAGETRDFHYGFTDITTGLAADSLIFNSHYHRNTFFDELPGFIRHMPDTKPLWVVDALLFKSTVLYPGIEASAKPEPSPTSQPPKGPLILWNHRWEHDKNPESFFNVLFSLSEHGFRFRVAVAGEQFKRYPAVFDQAKQRLADKLEHFGYQKSRSEYAQLLQRADIVVSTAYQENFGLSIAEAAAAGCFPLLPERLSYPEIIPQKYHAVCLYKNDAELEKRIGELLSGRCSAAPAGLSEAMRAYSWPTLIEIYDSHLSKLAAHR